MKHEATQHEMEHETATAQSLPPPPEEAGAGAIMAALTALDEKIRASSGGEPGAGIHSLLSALAGQFMGIPRSAPPAAAPPAATPPPNPAGDHHKGGKHDEIRREQSR